MTMTTKPDAGLAVRRSVQVNAPREHAFEVFTAGFDAWWPMATHHIGAATAAAVILEPHAGGRWFERGEDGSECDWGRVLVWDPPARLVLSWEIGADWKYDPQLGTEVEVRFIAEAKDVTRVELEHRRLERFGDAAAGMVDALGSAGGWGGLLASFAEAAARR